MKKPECPKCYSSDYLREKRLDGDTTCQSCGYKSKSSEWDISSPSFIALYNKVVESMPPDKTVTLFIFLL